jgi:hypothetical protein
LELGDQRLPAERVVPGAVQEAEESDLLRLSFARVGKSIDVVVVGAGQAGLARELRAAARRGRARGARVRQDRADVARALAELLPRYAQLERAPARVRLSRDRLGFPIHEDGTSSVVGGLHFVGVHFLRKRKSSLLIGVGEDAAIVARRVATMRGSAGG